MAEDFLRIPPFPGHRAGPLVLAAKPATEHEPDADLVALLRSKRIGGNFWGGRPNLPMGRDLVLAPSSHDQAVKMLEAAAGAGLRDRCILIDFGSTDGIGAPMLHGQLDWWHIAEAASLLWVDANHELAFVAALAERPLKIFGEGRFEAVADDRGLMSAVEQTVGSRIYASPFSGEAISAIQAVEMLSDWRRLIDRNRTISTVFGIAGWKRPTADPMLWDGRSLPRHASAVPTIPSNGSYFAAWKSRTPVAVIDRLAEVGLPVAEIEDGMIRGRGLGANCVPPLSIVIDFSGIYFDPARPSDLEFILSSAEMDEALLDRAARLRRMIIESGISKYDGGAREVLQTEGWRRILILGQVEDDRSILSGAPGQTNLGLLRRARELEPDSWLIYRPHPDVEAGHRKGHVPDQQALEYANEIKRGGSISALVESVDEVHCITSLGGFEALLRGKKVTTHGIPFYAGWGLTTDLGPVPARRNRRRSLDELVAATLILYPTYFDPASQLPCPPEVLVGRIARGEDNIAAPLAWLRTSQGKLKVALRRLWEAAA